MSKNKPKRYTVVLEDGYEIREYVSETKLNELKEKVYEYNSNPRNSNYFGNIKLDDSNNQILITRYKKITISSTLEDIDKSTINFNGENELKTLYKIDSRNPRHLYIAYRVNKEIRTLPIVYKKDRRYLRKDILKYEFSELGRNIDFLNILLKNKLIEYSSVTSYDDLDYLYALRNKLKYVLPASVSIYPMEKFFESFVIEKGKFRYLNFRLIANLVIEFNKQLEKDEIEETKDEEVFGQMSIKDLCMKELRDLYEEMQIACAEGTLTELYAHKLLPRREK